MNKGIAKILDSEFVTNSNQSNTATFDTVLWDNGVYIIYNNYIEGSIIIEFLVKNNDNIYITNFTSNSTINGTKVTMEVNNFWCNMYASHIGKF